MRRAMLGAAAVAAVAAAAVAVAVGGDDALAACAGDDGVFGAGFGGAFEMTSETGERVSTAQLIDRPTLVYFGYTQCPDICPTDAFEIGRALDLLQERGIAARALMISIDPARDTPEAMEAFTYAMHPEMIGLTGSEADVAAAAKGYRVYYAKAGDDPEYYLMDHSTYTYLALPGAGVVDFFRRAATPEEMADAVACFAEATG